MKRLLAALLTLSMLVGIVPFSAFAESPGTNPETFAAAQESPGLDDETVQSIVSDPLLQGQYAPPQQTQPTVDTSNMSMEATDSFGKLLVNSIDSQNSASSSENRVIGVTVDGSTATVEYVAAEDADIVVVLYTDDSEELMSASGTVDVFAMEENTGHSTVTVPLTGSIPASFIVKAFLLDKDEHAPLCNEFTSLAYTKDLSDLESSTIYDYPENQVVNLDEDVSNNFAVVTSDVTLITSDENIGTQNQITELDNDNLYYTIENASEEIQALQPGDILTYEYEPGYFLIARILDISVNGSTVRIHGDETLDIDDVFDVIKIGTTATTEDFTVNESALPSNIEYGGLVPVDDNETDGISTRASGSVRVGHDFKFSDSDGPFNGAIKVSITANPKYYKVDKTTYWALTFTGEVEVVGEVKLKGDPAELGHFELTGNPFPGCEVGFDPTVILKGEVSAKISLKVSQESGIEYISGTGLRPVNDDPVFTPIEVTAEGKIFLGVDFKPTAAFMKLDKLANGKSALGLTLKAEAGVEVKIELSPNEDSGDYIHECYICFKLTPSLKMTLGIEATGLWIFRMDKSFGEIKIPLDFATGHLSMTYHEWNWGECPHRLYKVTISLENCRSEGIAINQKNGDGSLTELGKTDESGTLVVYLKEGEYSLTATDVNKTYSKTFTVNQGAVDLAGHALTIELPLTSSVIVNPSNPIASGTCGTNLTWSLDGLGTLIISGTGSMTDFTSSYDDDTKENSVDSPWFEHRLDIQKIIINSGVTSIGNFAFAFCSNVTSVSVPDSVTRIGQGCFAQCANLTSIALPDDVTSIPMGSFTGCSSLVSISYSSKLESIGLMAFEDCVSLRSIDLPYGLTSIGYAAFMDCHSLTSITLPESLSGLGGFIGEVFANCTSLTSVTFPRSFTSTGFGTFGGCTSLVDVTIPDTITTIGASTFSDCTSLTNITLPSSITAIGEDAFSGCTSLTSFVIPNGVPSIGEDTFRNCYALTAITIPASVTTIGYAAFEYCYNLSSVNYAGTPAQWKQIDIDSGNTALEQAYEGNPISSCGDNATWSIDNAGTLTIRGTGEITDTPWSDPMILPYSVHIKNVVLEDGITGICSYAFDYTDIVSVTLPATLTYIDYSAFDGCSDLTTVNYAGSPEQWNNIKIANHNDELLNATRHYYSSNASTVSSEENSIFPSTATGNDHSFAASFSDLTPGVSYAVIVSRSEIDPLAPENLIYINQFRATSSGYQQSFQTPRSSALNADDMTYVIVSGIYSFDEAPTPTPTPGGGSSSGGGGGGGGGSVSIPDTKIPTGIYEHGTVTVSPESASKGDTVTITATPDKGYTLESLTVLDKDGKALALTDKGGGRYTFVMPAGKITVKAVFMDDNTMLNFFTDVHAEDYYYDAVLWAAQKGITGGMSDTLFAPNAACTRAQIVTFLWRAAGSPEPKQLSTFGDVPADAYYAKAVAWAVENGITDGTSDTTFAPGTICTRAHGVTFLSRAAKANTASGNSNFADVDANAYYASAVKWAVDNGITNGISSSLFGPDSSCTRAQIVTFLYRMYQGK